MHTSTETYLAELSRYIVDPQSSEISYRTAFQNYLASIFPPAEKYHIQHDPKAVRGNKPDFIILKHGVPMLYIEVKKPGVDLDKVEKGSQAERYFGYTNLIISDYCEFRFFRNGERYGDTLVLARPQSVRHVETYPERAELIVQTVRDFSTSHKEPIKRGSHLAKIMGGKARRIRDNVIAFLESESTTKDELARMRHFIKENLVAHFTTEDFADMYAQTLVYGLFAARYHDTTKDDFSREEAQHLVPKTNPFLMHFFAHIAGPTFPVRLKYIVDELCEVFTHADVRALMEEYYSTSDLWGEAHESPDPVIHFYEDFLREYDPKKKMELGVFYTPLPVVRFIVRGLDALLVREFGLPKGLADTSRVTLEHAVPGKGEKPNVVREEVHRVQVLDVATGTGTFLNETVAHIYGTFAGNEGRWGAYVRDELLPRLHGFELMMASYTIAHLKLGMTLAKEGVEPEGRLGVYLTNTLDAPHDTALQGSLFGVVESIAEESKLASRVKREYPIMVLMGNPPYSGISQNKHYTDNNVYKVEPGGKDKLKEKKNWLDDDYVKFIRFAESMVEKNGEGVVGMITAHGYLDNPTFRGMRWHLRDTFDEIYVLDLHGNTNKKETAPDGSKDENVFDIKTGVAVIFGVKKRRTSLRRASRTSDEAIQKSAKPLATVYHAELYGVRAEKFAALTKASIESMKWKKLPVDCDAWRVEGKGKVEYMQGFSVAELFPVNTTGVVTMGDGFIVDMDKVALVKHVEDFAHGDVPADVLTRTYGLGKNYARWVVENKKRLEAHMGPITALAYRPFDTRYTYFDKNLVWRTREQVMKHFVRGENVGIVFRRQQPVTNDLYVFCANSIMADGYIRSDNKGGESVAPLYIYTDDGTKTPNLAPDVVAALEATAGKATPEDILDYVYAYLHAPSYRKRYAEFLKTDFPRVPYPVSKEQFWKLVPLGTKLRGLHLLTDPAVAHSPVSFPVAGSNMVEKVALDGTRAYINATQYFDGVPKEVWEFYIGGYQPAQKYLKDRKGRVLTNAEFERYEQLVAALAGTVSCMREVDTVLHPN